MLSTFDTVEFLVHFKERNIGIGLRVPINVAS